MVLQDVESSAPESFVDESYPSDNDPYSSNASTAPAERQLVLDFSQLPQPLPVFGRLAGYTERSVKQTTLGYLATAQMMAQRPLTRDEAMAMAYHINKKQQEGSYGAAIGYCAGMFRWYQSRNTYRFPFWTPKPERGFDPSVFLSFKGYPARISWHFARFVPFVLVGQFVGQFFASNYATASAALKVQQDPRLSDLNAILKTKIKERRDRGATRIDQEANTTERIAGVMRGGQQTTNDIKETREQAQRHTSRNTYNEPREDDMSPTAGNESWSGSQDSYSESAPWSGSQYEAPQQQRKANYQSSNPSSEYTSLDDDASPTGGLFASEAQSNIGGGGSAWDRIRHGAASGQRSMGQRPRSMAPSSSVQKEQRDGSTIGDSFSFSSTEEERQLAKIEAQREFDQRIERERNGGDFTDKRRNW